MSDSEQGRALRFLDEGGETLAAADVPSGFRFNPDGGPEPCAPEDPGAVGVLRRDQEVWLLQPGPAGGLRVDGEPLSEEQPLSSGMEVRHGDTRFRLRVRLDGVDFARVVEKVDEGRGTGTDGPRRRRSRLLPTLVGLGLLAAVGGGVLWLYAKLPVPVEVSFQPGVDEAAIDGDGFDPGGEPLQLSPGRHEVEATLGGYHPLEESFEVVREGENRFEFRFQPLPGILRVETNVAEAVVRIDGEARGGPEGREFELPAGDYVVRVEAGERWIPFEDRISLPDKGEVTVLRAELKPNWGTAVIRTVPEGARVFDADSGELLGVTPARLEFLPGEYTLRVAMADRSYEPWETSFEIVPGVTVQPPVHRFGLVPGQLEVRTEPAGASVLVDGRLVDEVTPLTVEIRPGGDRVVQVLAEGYEEARRTVNLASEEQQTLEITLEPIMGRVRIDSEPAYAAISINGASRGFTPFDGVLPAREHEVTLRKEGFEDATFRVRPVGGQEIDREVRLTPRAGTAAAGLAGAEKAADQLPAVIEGPHGGRMILVRPGPFTMGSPPDEPGRRADEEPFEVTGLSPFYVSETEVMNEEFRAFRPKHDSGSLGRYTLDTGDRPVVNVSWTDAVAYTDWLSGKAGLRPVYGGGTFRSGVRLPTEAEFEYLLRLDAGSAPFPWGDFLPPPGNAGNFADAGAKHVLVLVMDDYEDGAVATSYVKDYDPNRLGLHDVSGNAAEWVHDAYVATRPATLSSIDPVVNGDQPKVIRGAGYKTHRAADLRSAARRSGFGPEPDVGFRIVLPVEAYLEWKGGKE